MFKRETFTAAALTAVLLAGCGASTAPKAAAPPYGSVVITNGKRTVTFTQMPQRVVAFNSYVTENMLVLGLGAKMAGTYVMSAGNTPLADYEEAYNAIPVLQTRSHEQALGLEPDLVAGQVGSFSEKTWGTVEMFAEKDINCYIIAGTLAAEETIEHIYEDLENLGKIFEVEERAAAVVRAMKAKVERVAAKTAGVENKVRVFVMDSNNGNEIYTTARGLQSNLIELAGGVNVTKNEVDARWFNTSVETVVDRDPDIIIFNVYGSQPVEEKIAFISENPALADVKAVRTKNYVIIPLQNVMQDVRAADTVETFAKAFYPDLFE